MYNESSYAMYVIVYRTMVGTLYVGFSFVLNLVAIHITSMSNKRHTWFRSSLCTMRDRIQFLNKCQNGL